MASVSSSAAGGQSASTVSIPPVQPQHGQSDCFIDYSKGPYTLTNFLVPVAGASQLAPVNWRVCHATGPRISLVPVTGTGRF